MTATWRNVAQLLRGVTRKRAEYGFGEYGFKHRTLVDVSDIFFFFLFFCLGAGEKEEASEEVAGGSVLMKNRGRGGVPRRRRGMEKGAGGMSVERGGG